MSTSRKPNPYLSRRRTDSDFEERREAYWVTFTCLTMIMLIFFVFLNSLTKPDPHRQHSILHSLAKQFLRVPVHHADTAAPASVVRPIPSLEKAPEKIGRAVYSISIPSEEVFEIGDDQIKAQYLPNLEMLGALIKRFNLDVEIDGHTDNLPMFGRRFTSNWELSISRAASVYRFFQDRGIASTHLQMRGMGEFAPLVSNVTIPGRARNRRVVLTLFRAEAGKNE